MMELVTDGSDILDCVDLRVILLAVGNPSVAREGSGLARLIQCVGFVAKSF